MLKLEELLKFYNGCLVCEFEFRMIFVIVVELSLIVFVVFCVFLGNMLLCVVIV